MPMTYMNVARLEELIHLLVSRDVRLIPATQAQYDALNTTLMEQGMTVSEWSEMHGIELVVQRSH